MSFQTRKNPGLGSISALILLSSMPVTHLQDLSYEPSYVYSEDFAEKLKDNSTFTYAIEEDKLNDVVEDSLLDSPNMTYESFLHLDQSNWF